MQFTKTIPAEVFDKICEYLPPIYAVKYRRLSRAYNAVLAKRHIKGFESACKKNYAKNKHSQTLVSHWLCCWPEEYQEIAAKVFGRQKTSNFDFHLCVCRIVPTAIPESLKYAIHLTKLNISNTLISSVPPELAALHKLKSLVLKNNRLAGPFPEVIGTFQKLVELDVSCNQITGPFPAFCFPKFARLKTMNLSHNQMTGEFDKEFEKFCWNATDLNLSFNQFTGPVLKTFSKFKELLMLNLSHNQFDNTLFPSSYEYTNGFQTLKVLYLQHNRLSGPVPECIGNLVRRLEILDLSYNQLDGELPHNLGNKDILKVLRKVLLHENKIGGEIPATLACLPQLKELDLRGNKLVGRVPNELIGKKGLKVNVNDNAGLLVTCLGTVLQRGIY
ncbi:hypothetical protein HDU98_008533 [Podochytrium sp. JEL0797]|nr:hypothetical protein HDU98_008533 [Podochytrium sp. JEL0797]